MSINVTLRDALNLRDTVKTLGIDIYDLLARHPEAVFRTAELEALLRHALVGLELHGAPRTRSKVAKQAVCDALGYPVPSAFRKVQPRFTGQDLDVYVQQADNLQIWNEELSPTRRYALVRVRAGGEVTAVRVVEGAELVPLDRTGKLTSKYQASRRSGRAGSCLVSPKDTTHFTSALRPQQTLPPAVLAAQSPVGHPVDGGVLSVAGLYEQLQGIVGATFQNAASDRRRGEALHRLVCRRLGLGSYADNGQFPDIRCQALEVKLQTARTIDLGLVTPSSEAPAVTLLPGLRHCDVRYLVAYGTVRGDEVCVDEVVLSSGVDFFLEFQRFEGRVQNTKLQLPLPRGFFEAE